ncbi:MAG TPA: tetraacyldisaccharide 4'-kinase [Pyrinomonadaceae bacterium]|jgi:tetraacyldisaccharide 4'-kinase|nr:tetraacyldisaccharide 4'-kinase [Pyrinomonadaceae bacterium]
MSFASRLALAPLSSAYGAAARARVALYRRGALRSQAVGAPVLSVGNLTAGGTGKTPLVEWLARAVASEGRRVCVLSRGYAREHARRRLVVSDGTRVVAAAREAGDEPLLLAERLLPFGVAVVCDADRAAAARFAIEELRSEVFVLDDGFQHLRLARDLNVATLDATDPWGGGRLLPAGLLREPVSQLARADCIVITRAELSGSLEGLRAEASRLSGGRPLFAASTRVTGFKPVVREARAESVGRAGMPRGAAAAFCGIGNPRAFFANLAREGFELRCSRAFADHHAYTQQDVDGVERAARLNGAEVLITTAKDAVKLRGLRFGLPCYEVEIEFEIDDGRGLLGLVRRALTAGDARRLPG